MTETFALPLAFLTLAFLILWFIIGSKGLWWVKVLLIVFCGYFSLSFWSSIDDLMGWPTSIKNVPDNFLVNWVVVKEPNKISHDPGSIYLWLNDLHADKEKPEESTTYLAKFFPKSLAKPRAYEMPYSKGMHQEASEIMKKLKAGKKVAGTKNGQGEGDGGEGKGDGDKEGKNGSGFSRIEDMTFYNLPPAKLPQKEPLDFGPSP